jgi:hypothetical protein
LYLSGERPFKSAKYPVSRLLPSAPFDYGVLLLGSPQDVIHKMGLSLRSPVRLKNKFLAGGKFKNKAANNWYF